MCTIMHPRSLATDTAQRLGRRARDRRKQLGMDQGELALVAGVSRRTVHAIENGKPTIQLAPLVAVLGALGFELAALPRGTRPAR
jgi:HTH-type transcriptional regulator / antitoxin HipB